MLSLCWHWFISICELAAVYTSFLLHVLMFPQCWVCSGFVHVLISKLLCCGCVFVVSFACRCVCVCVCVRFRLSCFARDVCYWFSSGLIVETAADVIADADVIAFDRDSHSLQYCVFLFVSRRACVHMCVC